MLEYKVTAKRIDQHGSLPQCKSAELVLDTDLAGRTDAFNPAELLLAALAACILMGIARVAPILHFEFRGLTVKVYGVRQDTPPKMQSIRYEILVDTYEPNRRLALLRENVEKFGTVFNTLAAGNRLEGSLRRAGFASTIGDPR